MKDDELLVSKPSPKMNKQFGILLSFILDKAKDPAAIKCV